MTLGIEDDNEVANYFDGIKYNQMKVGDTFGLRIVEKGNDEQDRPTIRFRLVKLKPVLRGSGGLIIPK